MNTIIRKGKLFDLCICDTHMYIEKSKYENFEMVCLFAEDLSLSEEEYSTFVLKLIELQCIYINFYTEEEQKLHNILDDIIANHSIFHITTAGYDKLNKENDFHFVAEMSMKHSYIGENKYFCVIIFRNGTKDCDERIQTVLDLHRRLNAG